MFLDVTIPLKIGCNNQEATNEKKPIATSCSHHIYLLNVGQDVSNPSEIPVCLGCLWHAYEKENLWAAKKNCVYPTHL